MPRFIEIDDPDRVSVKEAATKARKAGADYVVAPVKRGPRELLAIDLLDRDDDAPLAMLMDSRLPGRPGKIDDPVVVYTCPNGHVVRQRQSDRRRDCPHNDGEKLTR